MQRIPSGASSPASLARATDAGLDADMAALYGETIAERLTVRPAPAFIADGSPVVVRYKVEPLVSRGTGRIATASLIARGRWSGSRVVSPLSLRDKLVTQLIRTIFAATTETSTGHKKTTASRGYR